MQEDLAEHMENQYSRERVPEYLMNLETVEKLEFVINRYEKSRSKAKNKEKMTQMEKLYAQEHEFCVYEGPSDSLNYWRYFRLIAEDFGMIRFYEIFEDAPSLTVRNKVTCYDLKYDFQITLENKSEYSDLDQFILHRFVFRRPAKLSEHLWNAAIKRRQPLLIYVRDLHHNEHSKKKYHIFSELEHYEHPEKHFKKEKQQFIGYRDVIDFAMYKSYNELIEH